MNEDYRNIWIYFSFHRSKDVCVYVSLYGFREKDFGDGGHKRGGYKKKWRVIVWNPRSRMFKIGIVNKSNIVHSLFISRRCSTTYNFSTNKLFVFNIKYMIYLWYYKYYMFLKIIYLFITCTCSVWYILKTHKGWATIGPEAATVYPGFY